MTRKGFTLIELLVVVAILGGLVTMVVIRFGGAQGTARDTQRQSDLRQYQNSLEVYANRTNGVYPVANGNVVSLCATLGLTTCPNDPQGTNPYRYAGTAINYVLWARMERLNDSGQVEYFILCSTGQVGKSITQPGSANCPI